jgi:hypothetical protein
MKKQTNNWKRSFLVFMFCVMPCIISCGYWSISSKDNIMESPVLYKGNEKIAVYNSVIIKGNLVGLDELKNTTLLIAYPLSSEGNLFTDYVILNSTGPFTLYLPEGRYRLYTITDFNNDGIYKENEVSGVYGFPAFPKEISLRKGDVVKDIVIYTSREYSGKITFPQQLSIKEKYDTISQLTYNGQISKIYDEKFSP